MNITLRPYQQECKNIIDNIDSGSYIVQLFTGGGKTVIFSRLERKGRVLILAHREELINQPIKYYDCPVGIEMASHTSNGEEVVAASIQSIVRRLDRFDPDTFDMIITDEAHHASALTYRKIYEHFNPRLHIGFTATPNRTDGVRLDDIYQDIIFSRDLRWGIQNGYSSDIFCRRAHIGYDLSAVKTRMGDYAPGELEKSMDGTADAIAEAYEKMAIGSTLIFAVSVEQCNEIAKRIPGAVVVTGETRNRAAIVEAFTNGDIPCIVSVAVFLEGTDMPRIETIIMARPTRSETVYVQAIGRGLRLYPGKDKLNLIDCVGVSTSLGLCSAPTLLGIDISELPQVAQDSIQGDLFDLPNLAERASDTPASWIKNIKIVDLWAKDQQYETHGVNWFRLPTGDLVLTVPAMVEDGRIIKPADKLVVPAQDELGRTKINGETVPMQVALDKAFVYLRDYRGDAKTLWRKDAVKRWGKSPATPKQLQLIRRRCGKKYGFDPTGLTKGEASLILNRIMSV